MDCSICAKLFVDERIKLAILREVCEEHFLAQYVKPLQKERDNSQRVIDALNGNIKEFLDELGKAKRDPIAPKLNRQFLRIEKGIRIFCHKCNASFESGIECLQHEYDCKGKPKRLVKEKHIARPKIHGEILEDDNNQVIE